MSDSVTTVTAKRTWKPQDNGLYVLIGNTLFSNFSAFQFSRDIEQVPSTFQMEVPVDGNSYPTGIQDNQTCTIYKNKRQVFHGYMEIFSTSISGNKQHAFTISGRSKLRDLCDPNPVIAGTAISGVHGISDICQLLCSNYNVKFQNLSKTPDKTAWDSVPFNLGDTAFSVIARYARYEGKLLYDNGYGDLIVNDVSTNVISTFDETSQIVNATFQSDVTQRFKEYQVYWQPFTTQSQTGLPPCMKATDPEPTIWNGTERTKVIINSTSDEDGSIAQRLANWEANRNYGRSKQVHITLPDWKDSDVLYDVNQLVMVNLPEICVYNMKMVISSVTYSITNEQGSTVTLVMYPSEAFMFEPISLFSANPALQSLPSDGENK